MKLISVSGIGGGTGCTTVTAQLAECLAAHNKRVIAFDFSPQNTLRLHFGMPWQNNDGIALRTLAGEAWHEAAYRSGQGVSFLPFGRVSPEAASEFLACVQRDPAWLRRKLDQLDEPAEAYILIDTPQRDLCAQVYDAADLILIVMEPDTRSYAALSESCAHTARGKKTVYLLNGFDPTRELDRDIARLLRELPDINLCPIVIHRDELVREALANKMALRNYASHSQANWDFDALATWLSVTLARADDAPDKSSR